MAECFLIFAFAATELSLGAGEIHDSHVCDALGMNVVSSPLPSPNMDSGPEAHLCIELCLV